MSNHRTLRPNEIADRLREASERARQASITGDGHAADAAIYNAVECARNAIWSAAGGDLTEADILDIESRLADIVGYHDTTISDLA